MYRLKREIYNPKFPWPEVVASLSGFITAIIGLASQREDLIAAGFCVGCAIGTLALARIHINKKNK